MNLTLLKDYLNKLLALINLRLQTLTKSKKEDDRISKLKSKGHFNKPVFIIPNSFRKSKYKDILENTKKYTEDFNNFSDSDTNEVNYNYDNDYFTSPDTEVLYTIVREYKPKKIVEIGSGNSSLIIRQAINDSSINTTLVSIDPEPRRDIMNISDKCIESEVELLDEEQIINNLSAGDILFIDSSHEIKLRNDVLFIYLNLIPKLPKGVLLHIHDIFLPYEYPEDWVNWNWSEQYLVQSILLYGNNFDVIWPGYYLQKNLPDFGDYFLNIGNNVAQSLWLIKKSDCIGNFNET